ncbi:acetyltransferase [Fontibacillus sp. BL9]|uniref:acetyltransferase n=1 Tax=Fontibacillus sp. BL9 TaxID=3389971 RepID=UPI00397B3D52
MSELPLILLGGGGHAKVCLELLLRQGRSCIGYTAVEASESFASNLRYMGSDNDIFSYSPDEVMLVNGIGKVAFNSLRRDLYQKFKEHGYSFATLIHESSVVASSALIGEGVQIMAASVVQANASLNDNVIINTRAVVEHDCTVDVHSHISPGAIVCGTCKIGEHVHIGAGATLIEGIQVGGNSVIGAGSLVLRDVRESTMVYGFPAKEVTI